MKKTSVITWFKRLILILLVVRILSYFGILVTTANTFIAPHNGSICCATPADNGWEYETVTFTSADGMTLHGWYMPSENETAVILLHGHNGNRTQMLSRAEMLARHDFGVLLYDLRGHGESLSESRSLGWQDVEDVAAALVYLQQRDDVDPNRIGLLGFSLGGQIALRAAQFDGVKAVATDGPGYANYQDIPPPTSFNEQLRSMEGWLWIKIMERKTGLTAPTAIVEQIADIAPRPILFIGVGGEVPLADFYYDAAQEPKALWNIPEADHGQGPKVRPEEYEERLVSFFGESLK
ncbi:MAG: alpha/beta fold hydrolase [Chloroflexi bacterium]|nr:alpha/beta fold hydrolase [Chloroflexota bacterium]